MLILHPSSPLEPLLLGLDQGELEVILLVGFHAGYLSKPEILDLSQQLVNHGIRISSPILNWLKTELDNDH